MADDTELSSVAETTTSPNSTSHTTYNPKASLTGVPPEIRANIFKHLFEGDYLVLSEEAGVPRQCFLRSYGRAVLKASKQLRYEAEPRLLADLLVIMEAYRDDFSIDAYNLPDRVTKQIRYVVLDNMVDSYFSPYTLSSRLMLQGFESLQSVHLRLSLLLVGFSLDLWHPPGVVNEDNVLVSLAERTAFRHGRDAFKKEIGISAETQIEGFVTIFIGVPKRVARVNLRDGEVVRCRGDFGPSPLDFLRGEVEMEDDNENRSG